MQVISSITFSSYFHLFKASLISRVWTPLRGINIHLTNGLAILSRVDGLYGKGVASDQTPEFVENARIVKSNFSKKRSFLYAPGVQLSFYAGKNTEFSFAAEYNHGFSRWNNSRLDYLEGEGINRSIEGSSDGSFYAITFGLKHSLRGN